MGTEPPQSNPPDTESMTKLATMLFEHTQGLINFADGKAQLILAANALFAAAVINLQGGVVAKLLDGAAPAVERLTALTALMMFVALLLSFFYAIRVARPDLLPPEQGHNLFFFGHILQRTEKEFVNQFLGQSDDDMRRAILSQVYAKSRIASNKFLGIRRSLNFLVLTLLLWIVTELLIALG